jgi:hypothetical protein
MTLVHDHNSKSTMQGTEGEEYGRCAHLLLNHAPVHFQLRMQTRSHRMCATKTDHQQSQKGASSETMLTEMEDSRSFTSQAHIEVLIDKEMLSKLQLLAAMHEATEEDADSSARRDKTRVGVSTAVTIEDSFQALGVEGYQFLTCCSLTTRCRL